MVRLALLTALLIAVLPAQAMAQGPYGPFGQPQEDYGPGITVAGAGLARVTAPSQPTQGSVERAIDAARPRAVARALADARRRAGAIADAVGVSLGGTRAIELEPGFAGREPCRRSRRTQELRCVAPPFASSSATVTFEIVGGPGSSEGARELSASATDSGAVEFERRTSPAIRRAVFAARLAATPGAARAARENVELAAAASGLTLGPLFSIVEQPNPYGYNIVFGAFAPGKFCGTVSRAVVRRDPKTGSPRVVRRRRVRRCFAPRTLQVSLDATYLAQGG
jgi:uncharacterized protein DUF541